MLVGCGMHMTHEYCPVQESGLPLGKKIPLKSMDG